MQQALRAEGARGEDHLIRLDGAPPTPQPGAGPLGVDEVAARGGRTHRGDRRQWMDGGTSLLGEIEVVLHQRVLRSMPAAGHAASTVEATGPLGAGTTEVGIGCGTPGLGEVDPYRRGVEGVPDAHPIGDRPHRPVGRRVDRVRRDAQHALGLVVVRSQLGAPVGDIPPLRILEEGRQWFVEGVGVDQAPPAHPGAGQHEHPTGLPLAATTGTAEQVDPLDAEAAESRRPEEAAQPPGRLRELMIGEAAPRLQHRDRVTLLDEPQGRHTPAEAGPDDHHVIAHATIVTRQ